MASKTMAALLSLMILTSAAQPVFACRRCSQRPVRTPSPPSGGGCGSGCFPTTNPPPPPQAAAKCSLDVLKLGLCVDVLDGLVHVGLGKPVENMCCPVLQGLLELEAASCLCTAIKLRVLSLDIYIPLALQVLITCGKEPPAGYLCPLN